MQQAKSFMFVCVGLFLLTACEATRHLASTASVTDGEVAVAMTQDTQAITPNLPVYADGTTADPADCYWIAAPARVGYTTASFHAVGAVHTILTPAGTPGANIYTRMDDGTVQHPTMNYLVIAVRGRRATAIATGRGALGYFQQRPNIVATGG